MFLESWSRAGRSIIILVTFVSIDGAQTYTDPYFPRLNHLVQTLSIWFTIRPETQDYEQRTIEQPSHFPAYSRQPLARNAQAGHSPQP